MPTDNLWTTRVWSEFRAGTLTRAYRDVLLTLRTYRGRGGLICPSHETLADRARSGVSTVQRALRQARRLGLVDWTERRVRASWRWLRTSNSYFLSLPTAPVDPALRMIWRRTTGQRHRGEVEIDKKETAKGHKAALIAMFIEARRLPDLLSARRRIIEARLLTRGGV